MKKLRKNLLLIATVVLTAISFSSCSNDDEENAKNWEQLIIGKWKITKVMNNSGTNILGQRYITMEFKSNGNVVFEEEGEKDNLSYKIDGNKLSIIEKEDSKSEMTIQTLTSKELVFRGIADLEDIPAEYTFYATKIENVAPDDPNLKNKIIGEWKSYSIKFNGRDYDGWWIVMFRADGTCLFNDTGVTENNENTYTISGNILKIYSDDGDTLSFNIDLDGNDKMHLYGTMMDDGAPLNVDAYLKKQ